MLEYKYYTIDDNVYMVPTLTSEYPERYVIKKDDLNREIIYFNIYSLFDKTINRHPHCRTPFGRYHSHE